MTPLFLYLQQYFSPVTVLAKSFPESVRALSRYFGMKVISLEIRYKERKILMFGRYLKKKAPLTSKFDLIVVSIVLKMCERSWR